MGSQEEPTHAVKSSKSRALRNPSFHVMRGITYLVVAAVGYVVLDIVVKGIGSISWSFLTESPKQGGVAGGILAPMVGTIYLVAGAMLVAFPIGVGGAIYLAEYAKNNRLERAIRVGIITLAGVPSIVFGLFGLGVFVVLFGFGTSLAAGCLTLASMILPIIMVSTEEALKAVPQSLRQASLALGATKWQTIWHIVLPLSFSGILTGSILSIGRAAGETAPLLFTAVAFFLPRLPHSIFDQVMALPYHLFVIATQYPDAETAKPMQYGTAFVLVALVLGVNLVAAVLRNRSRKKLRW
ncbi:MAG: phosphate ABC transporter permease PtsA [Candidatus Coatesbacteria bacterium]|nr:MAG: phosphate ABC transporter permease PtsA [Candidatus Coatesbacteria bacterium]HDM59954.1 phosphate ABC transporter permease PstA [Bacillota bacterium]